jgi:hypothetical protein
MTYQVTREHMAVFEKLTERLDGNQVLERALEIIEKGWVQGHLGNIEGVCMMGALNKACTGNYNQAPIVVENSWTPHRNAEGWREALEALKAALKEMGVKPSPKAAWGFPVPLPDTVVDFGNGLVVDVREDASIPAFNDYQSTTLEDVRLVFKRAINAEEKP